MTTPAGAPGVPCTPTRFYDRVVMEEVQRGGMDMIRHQNRMRDIQRHKALFLELDADLAFVEQEQVFFVPPPPERVYCGHGGIRVGLHVNDCDALLRVCKALAKRGYMDGDESYEDMRMMRRGGIVFCVTCTTKRKAFKREMWAKDFPKIEPITD